MLRKKLFYRNDIQTCKKAGKLRKNRTEVCNRTARS